MKLISFLNVQERERLGILVQEKVYDLERTASTLAINLAGTMAELLQGGERAMNNARKVEHAISEEGAGEAVLRKNLKMLAPVPHPTSCRDAYAFRAHVAAARRNRGVEMIPEFDQFPVFYFTNHQAIVGEGEVRVEKDQLEQLDFELECAVVIGRRGKNLRANEADAYIAGYTIMNDFSARKVQMEEMKLSLGPAKGKDFATALGPWLVTPDELEKFLIKTPQGNQHDLKMTARHNGKLISEGNLKDMNYTFAEILERVSYGVEVFPGDVIGSGTVGTGCYMELNGTAKREAKGEFTPVWLKPGDEIELEITGLGTLKNKIIREEKDHSLTIRK